MRERVASARMDETDSLLGYELVGAGGSRVVVLNDWLCDTSTWDHARVYLDVERFTWAFVDLRGYGRSRGRVGEFGVREAARDVLALIDSLGWKEVAIIGHSMSTIVALHLAQAHPARARRVVLITPPPPRGFGMDTATLEKTQAVVRDDAARAEMIRARLADRYSTGWAAFKTARWIATSDAAAAAAYVAMYARDGLPDPTTPVPARVLAITGDEDMPVMRAGAVRESLGALCPSLEVTTIAGCGHYPMQEAPPRTVAVVEGFLESA